MYLLNVIEICATLLDGRIKRAQSTWDIHQIVFHFDQDAETVQSLSGLAAFARLKGWIFQRKIERMMLARA